MSDQWYIKTKNGKRGPYSIKKIQRYIDAGAIRPNAGLGDGEGNWVAAAAVEGLNFPAEVIAQLRAAMQAKTANSATSAAVNAASGATTNPNPDSGTLSGATEQATFELQQRSHILDERGRQLQERQDQLESRATELEELAISLQQRGETLAKSEQAVGDREQAVSDREQAVSDREQEIASREDQVQEQLQEQADQLRLLESDQDEKTSQRVNDLEVELADTQQTLETIRDQLANQKQDYEDRLSEISATLAQRDQELNDAAERSQLLDERSDELDQMQEELTAREQSLCQKETAFEEQGVLLAEREVEVGNRHSEVMDRQRELESLRCAADSAAAETSQAEESIQQLQQTISDQRSELRSLREDLKNKSQQLDEIRSEPVCEESGEPEQPTTQEAVSDGNPADLILSEKKKLLQEFAARQESLSRREADLIRRESELTRRELDIVVMSDSEPIRDDDSQPTTEPELESIVMDDAVSDHAESDVPSQETKESDGDPEPARGASSWEEALGRTEESGQAYELADLDDPRYAPWPDEEPQSADEQDEQDEFFDDVLGSMTGGPPESATVADGSGEHPASGAEEASLDLVPKDRLPSEMMPSELPEYDGVSAVEPSAGIPTDLQDIEQDVVEPETAEMEPLDLKPNESDATGEFSLYDFRRSAYDDRFGPCSRYDVDSDDSMRVDVSVHQPDGTRDFVTLVTSGMSDYPIAMPNGQRSVRAELLLYVTHVDELAIEVLRNAAKIPYRRKHGLSIGTTGSLSELGEQVSESHQQDCVYMLPVIESDSKPIPAKETIGSAIQLFWLVTITDAERKLIETSGIHKFLSLLEKNNHAVFFDLTRECYVKRKGWFRR